VNLSLRTASAKDAVLIADFAKQAFKTAFGPDNDPVLGSDEQVDTVYFLDLN